MSPDGARPYREGRRGSDLALLKVDAITPFVYLSHSNGVPAGMDVITMGHPQVSVLGITTRSPGASLTASGECVTTQLNQFSAEVQKVTRAGPDRTRGMVVGWFGPSSMR